MRPRLETLVLDAKKARIAKSRGALLSDAYTQYMRTLRPPHWAALPRTRELRALPEVQALLQRSVDADVPADEFSALLNDGASIRTWMEGRRRVLEAVIASGESSRSSVH